MFYQVKEVSKLTGVSVRMLHHYDKIDLLKPAHVTDAGYRQYSDDDLTRLQQVMFLRELDFSLEVIKEMMSLSDFHHLEFLDEQTTLLRLKMKRLEKIIKTIEKTKERLINGEAMSSNDKFSGFDMKEIEAHKAKYADEVKEKWGNSKAYAQSEARTKAYRPEDYKRIQDETNGIYSELVSLMDQDVSNERVQVLVGALRQGITDNFYDCDVATFIGLGQMYVDDPRFTKNLDKHGEGFAKYLSQAIAYYGTQN